MQYGKVIRPSAVGREIRKTLLRRDYGEYRKSDGRKQKRKCNYLANTGGTL